MKISDFKEWDKPEFMEILDKIIKQGGRCHRVDSKKCPFNKRNSKTDYYCTLSDSAKVEHAKAFKRMVEEEKEIKFLEEFFNGKFENGKIVVMGGMFAQGPEDFKKINKITKEIIENTDKKLNEVKSPLDEITKKLENGELYYVPYHSGKGHYYLSAKGLSENFKREYLQKWWDGKSEEEKVENIIYYKEMKVNIINKVVEITLEDGTKIEERAVKLYKNDEGQHKIGDIKGLNGFYRAIMFKPKEEEKEEEFKVKIIDTEHKHYGKTGKAKRFNENQVQILLETGVFVYAQPKQVEKVEGLKATANGQEVSMATENVELPKEEKEPKHKNGAVVILLQNPYEPTPRERKGLVHDWVRPYGNAFMVSLLDTKGIEWNEASKTQFIAPKEWIKEYKQEYKQEPFELKEGMKFKYLEDNRVYIVSTIDGQEVWNTDGSWDYMETINWEETIKLNEVKEENKKEIYVIWNPKGQNPRYKHTSLEDAEKEAERLAKANPNQEFYVLKAVGKVKGSVSIEWEK